MSNPLCNAISIHAPTRGATKKERLKGGKNEFQSTLPRGERRAELQALETVQAISIHAPTRGATGDSRRPAVGNFYFNPRSHEGSDHYPFLLKLPRSHISIHAPTRGATFSATQTIQIVSNFNPRSHEGSDSSNLSLSKIGSYFNPRSHEGSDIRHCGHLLEYPHFNPRSHEGSDSLLNFSIVSAKGISIHAPTRGATIFSGAACADREYFNPRSHEGSDSNFRQKVLFSLSKNCLKYLILTTNYFN